MMRRRVAALFILLLLLAPCLAPPASAGRDLVSIFADLDAGGANDKTVKELRDYIRENPSGESVDEALLRLGRVYAAKRDLDAARHAFEDLINGFPASAFVPEARYELALVMFRAGRADEAKALASSVASSNGSTVILRARGRRLLQEIASASDVSRAMEDRPAIGLLLPLKGGYAKFGEDALSGALLAAGVFGGSERGGSERPVEIIVKDVGTEASAVEGAVNALADDKRVAGFIGPLLSSTASEAARVSVRARLPEIALSQKEGVTEAGDYVFRNFITSQAQAAAIAAYACGVLKAKKIAVLYPQNNYGTELARLFEAEAAQCGSTIVREASYPQGTTDFSFQMKQVFGVQVKERMEGRRKIKEYTPSVHADALYIPDSFETVSLIASYLDYYNIKDVRLLGSNGWNSRKLVELGGKYVEGAVFVDGFSPESRRPGAMEFTARFREAYGRAPGVIEAHAYDAVRAMTAAMPPLTADGMDREAVKKGLHDMKDTAGATGPLSFDAKREAVKRLFILTVKDGRIVDAPEN